MTGEYEPTIDAIPEEMMGKLEPAQIFHEITDHRWFLSEERSEAVSLPEATASYLANVLPARRDEARLLRTAANSEAD